MSLLFYCKVLFCFKVTFYFKANPFLLFLKPTFFKTSGSSKQKKNYFVEKCKSLNRIIKHNKRYNCLFIASAKIPEYKENLTIQLLWATAY